MCSCSCTNDSRAGQLSKCPAWAGCGQFTMGLPGPGHHQVHMQAASLQQIALGVTAGAAFHVVIAAPFLRTNARAYLSRAFDFSRCAALRMHVFDIQDLAPRSVDVFAHCSVYVRHGIARRTAAR